MTGYADVVTVINTEKGGPQAIAANSDYWPARGA